MKTKRSSAAAARSLQRQAAALQLRRSGHTLIEIAQRIGVGKSQVHRLVNKALAQSREQVAASADELLLLELARLDGMLEKSYPMAADGDVRACDTVLKIIARRCRLLGLDAPVRIEATGQGGGPIATSSSHSIDPSMLSTSTLRELLDARTSRGSSAADVVIYVPGEPTALRAASR